MTDSREDMELKQVDEDRNRERLREIWNQYGRYIIGLAVLVVGIVAGRELYTSHVTETRATQSAAFEAVNRSLAESPDDFIGAVTAWEEAQGSAKGGYEILAGLKLASAKLEAGDTDGAIADYDALAIKGSLDDTQRDMARLLAAMLVAGEQNDWSGALERLTLISGDDRPWRYSAREQQALVLMKMGRTQEALSLFEDLSFDQGVPTGLQSRAATLRDHVQAMLSNEAPKTSQEVGADDGR